MSLIGDALRKARQEAADRENDRTGILFSAKIADSPTRSNLGLGLALGAIIAVAATVAGGGSVWWLLSRSEVERPTPTETSIPEAAVRTSVHIPTSASPDSSGRPVSTMVATPAPSADPIPTTLGTGAADQPEIIDRRSRPDPSGDEGLSEGFAGMQDGDEVYILEADLGDRRLSLDFIVFRSDDSFVEINGVELHVGGVVEGYRVKAIEADRVRLSNGHRSIVLRAP